MKNALFTLLMFALLLVTTGGTTQAQDHHRGWGIHGHSHYYSGASYHQPTHYRTTYYRPRVAWVPQTTWLSRPRTFGFGFNFGFYRTPRVQTFRWQHVPHRYYHSTGRVR